MPTPVRLLLVETVVPENDSKHFGKILDLNMMAEFGARADANGILRPAHGRGLQDVWMIATMAWQSLVEAPPNRVDRDVMNQGSTICRA